MSEFSVRVKTQLEQFNSSIDQIINASRGLYVKIRQESNKQFDELVKAGEQQLQAEESFLEQLKKDIINPFEDVKSSLDQLKNASVGLVVKARKSSESYFDELVELGSTTVEEVTEVAKKTVKKVSSAKKTEKAVVTE